jgi:HEAT repeat protein
MRWGAPLAVAAVAAAYFAGLVGYGINLEDEGLLLAQIGRTLHGQQPYVDFHTGYTPGVFYLNAALMRFGGGSVLPIRWGLVLVNAAATGVLFALARRRAGAALAAAAALGWAAFLPCFVGDFASFNIPYPAWYAGLFWLLAQAAYDRHLRGGGAGALVAAGLAAGLAFSFKPNVGVLAALAAGMGLAFAAAGDGDPDRRLARVLLALAGVVLLVLLSFNVVSLEFPFIIVAPLVLVLGRLWWARVPTPRARRLVPALGLFAAGGLATTLPWVSWLLARLGVARFLREVLLVGSDAERIYATPYPLPFGFPGGWALVAALALAAAALVGLAAERGHLHLPRVTALAVAAAVFFGGLWWEGARMPEGVAWAIVGQVQQMGFFVAPPLSWGAAAVVLARVRAPGRAAADAGTLGMVLFALLSYVQLYPRVDSMHLIVALPSMLVLGAAATRRAVEAWGAVLDVRPARLGAGVVAVAAVSALLAAVPNYTGLVGVAGGRLAARPQVGLAVPGAPVHVESARSDDVRALNAVIAYLGARLPARAPLFGFPALGLVGWALDRPNPGPHDYFFPGRPDHRAEAEVVRALAAARPPYVVTMNRRLGFFFESPAYYFLLRRHVRQHYTLAARYGRYDVLRRRRRAGPSPLIMEFREPTLDPHTFAAELADRDREHRRAVALGFLARAEGPSGLADVVRALGVDPPTELLLVRTLGEVADGRAIPFLMEEFTSAEKRVSDEAASALTLLAIRAGAERYHFARPGERSPAAGWRDVPLPKDVLRGWLAERKPRRKVGVFAARALAVAGDREAAPILDEVIRTEVGLVRREYGAHLRIAAAEALVRLGRPAALCTLVDHLSLQIHEAQDTMPSVIIDEARRNPEAAASCLAHGLESPSPLERETSAWIAGAVPLAAVAPALRQAAADATPAVRIAAVWALGRLRDPGARPVLARLAGDDDPELRAFAAEALARLGAGGASS